ncbi:MAG: bifunctional alpha,alpha-trehalose-phosphate synthase (UDP-forming)/trehalose-phosphatase, partial [bacterium]
MGKVIIVSNRLPVSISKKGTEIIVQPSMGGLATGMKSFYKSYESIWIGWPGLVLNRTNKKERDEITGKLKEEKCAPVFLSQKQINQYYLGFSNKTVWPLFHYFPQYTVYQENLWDTYRKVNQIFADEIMKFASEDDIIWIHDYHLLLLPEMVRKKMPGVTIGFFLHIPFPSFEIFRLLPWRKEILKGILGADLVGYHTYDYQRHFISSVRRIFGKEVVFNQIMHGRRKVKVDAFPMGIDYNKFQAEAKSRAELPFSKMSKFQQAMKRFRNQDKEKRVILSIDRLDYSKGIPNRLEAYEHFLEKNPKYREKVILIIVAVPSRTNVEHYQLLKKNVDELVGRINGRFGTINWVPIWYHYRGFQFERLTELYNQADIGLLTPIRDGMNLIAKEYIACKTDNEGVLILSEMAGASKELGEALIVNPNDNKEIANAILEAIKMPRKEQIRRNQVMQKRLERYNVESWAQDFMHNLNKMHSQKKATVDK